MKREDYGSFSSSQRKHCLYRLPKSSFTKYVLVYFRPCFAEQAIKSSGCFLPRIIALWSHRVGMRSRHVTLLPLMELARGGGRRRRDSEGLSGQGDEQEVWPWLLGVGGCYVLSWFVQCQEPEIWGWLGYTRWIPGGEDCIPCLFKTCCWGTLEGI